SRCVAACHCAPPPRRRRAPTRTRTRHDSTYSVTEWPSFGMLAHARAARCRTQLLPARCHRMLARTAPHLWMPCLAPRLGNWQGS
ncbi:hypothetical protein PFISCL1PPCAC_22546, partial [Pristionchus fissidentatus]